ncbi:hypothetical protein EKO27_g7794, partial [Xylaria grammica]
MPCIDLGDSIPPNTAHAVSVSLPTWKSNVGYEEGEQWVLGTMITGYPRFFIHKAIQALSADIVAKHGRPGQSAMLFPTRRTAQRCADFIRARAEPSVIGDLAILRLVLDPAKQFSEPLRSIAPSISQSSSPRTSSRSRSSTGSTPATACPAGGRNSATGSSATASSSSTTARPR